MTDSIPTEATFDRLAGLIMRRNRLGYQDAMRLLSNLQLRITCGPEIRDSVAYQAALLTAVNAGKRAFHGGVYVQTTDDVQRLVPWSGSPLLGEAVRELGARPLNAAEPDARCIHLGSSDCQSDAIRVVCTGWRAGIVPGNDTLALSSGSDFATGGIAAAGLAVARAFSESVGIAEGSLSYRSGISLWRPDLPWTDIQAEGPTLESVPKKLWILGLGHLGQAFLWNMGMLPYPSGSDGVIFLQDFDRLIAANLGAGLLSDGEDVGKMKSRICSDWLEARGISTRILERHFDETVHARDEEPPIAFCGFDNPESRAHLEEHGFDLVVECGLGGRVDDFDRILLHTFPDAGKSARTRWGATVEDGRPQAASEFAELLDLGGHPCGVVGETLAGKAISTAFVGAFAGALAIGELLRAYHGGIRCELVNAHLRATEMIQVVTRREMYQVRVARSGFLSVRDNPALVSARVTELDHL